MVHGLDIFILSLFQRPEDMEEATCNDDDDDAVEIKFPDYQCLKKAKVKVPLASNLYLLTF
jgi:hypothetical protein